MKKHTYILESKRFIFSITLFLMVFCHVKSVANNGSKTDSKIVVKPDQELQKHLQYQTLTQKEWLFVENKGQLMDENRKLLSAIKYYIHQGGVNVYCKPGMVSFVFAKVEKDNKVSEASGTAEGETKIERGMEKAERITVSRMDLVFIGVNPNAEVVASDQQSYYENYYTAPNRQGQSGDANNGISNVHTFKKLTYKNIYNHIDLLLNVGQGQGLEYAFLVHPGGKVSDISLRWDGAEEKQTSKGQSNPDGKQTCIYYENELGKITESAPETYSNGKKVESQFIKNGKNTAFKVGSYDKTKDLLIDPHVVATYYGGLTEFGYGACTDRSGNVYVTGFTISSTGIATSGAYQTSFKGDLNKGACDAFLAKFNSGCQLSWGTYYGGSDVKLGPDQGDTRGLSVSTDLAGNINVTGYTGCITDIATSGAYQTGLGVSGYIEGFLAQFSSSGALSWATYFGGSEGDYCTAVTTDGSGNIYITGSTASDDSIATSGAHQTVNAGNGDAFLAKFTHSGTLLWATYYGGSGLDVSEGVGTDGSGNVYITGYTNSSSGIATAGTYMTTYGGGRNSEVFIAKFNSTGVLSWGTYYGGNADDESRGITIDVSGNIYITGFANSAKGIATNGAYQTSYAGDSDAFLAKFTSLGSLSWATYFGGSAEMSGGSPVGGTGEETGYAVCTDATGNVYMAGVTTSSNGISTSGSYQSNYGGGGDAFLAEFSSSGTEILATYLGGGGGDAAFGVCTDALGNIYMTGLATSTTGIATSGAYQTTNSLSNAFLVNFHYSPAGISPIKNADDYDLTIFPNPFTNKTLVDFNLPQPAHVKIRLIDMEGKVICIPGDEVSGPGKNEIELNTAPLRLAPGAYFVNLEINGEVISRKIVSVR